MKLPASLALLFPLLALAHADVPVPSLQLTTVVPDDRYAYVQGVGTGADGQYRVLHYAGSDGPDSVHLFSTNVTTKQSVDLVGDLGWCAPGFPSLSPDHQRVYFSCEHHVYVSDFTTRRRLASLVTGQPGLTNGLAGVNWLPNGQLLVNEIVETGPERRAQVFFRLFDRDGNFLRQVTSVPAAFDTWQTESGYASELLTGPVLVDNDFAVVDQGGDRFTRSIGLLSLKDGSLKPLVQTYRLTSRFYLSPDKQWLVYTNTSGELSQKPETVGLINLADPARRFEKVLSLAYNSEPRFTPDGKHVFFQPGGDRLEMKAAEIDGIEIATGKAWTIHHDDKMPASHEIAVTNEAIYFGMATPNGEAVVRHDLKSKTSETIAAADPQSCRLAFIAAAPGGDRLFYALKQCDEAHANLDAPYRVYRLDRAAGALPKPLASFFGEYFFGRYYPQYDLLLTDNRLRLPAGDKVEAQYILNLRSGEVTRACQRVYDLLSAHSALLWAKQDSNYLYCPDAKPGIYQGEFR